MTVTELQIAADHPAFAGHFPGMPIVPGVVLLDEALYAISRLTGEHIDRCTLGAVKFRRIVRPGQPLTLQFERIRAHDIRFEIHSSGQMIANGTITLAQAIESPGDR
jgi:3-hydroxymyristoyl/3-hydroxydecanoyl-(acyl carrier protein) dehydratase